MADYIPRTDANPVPDTQPMASLKWTVCCSRCDVSTLPTGAVVGGAAVSATVPG